jgi:hypothetical protein
MAIILWLLTGCGGPATATTGNGSTAETGTTPEPTSTAAGTSSGTAGGPTTTPAPPPVTETHTCTGSAAYAFTWDTTLDVGSTRKIVIWGNYSAWYRSYIASAGDYSLDDIAYAVRYESAAIRSDGHVMGACSWVDYSAQGAGAGFMIDEYTLVADP